MKSAKQKTSSILQMPTDGITPYANNPRANDAAVDAVAASIREFGFRSPIVVDKDGVIIAGHTRLKAAIKLGLKTVPVIVADDLTPEQARAYRIADNRTSELSDWDFSKLSDEINALDAELRASLADLDLDGLLADAQAAAGPKDGLTDPDDVPEPPAKPVTKPGDLWLLGEHRLLCGDSTKAEDVARVMGREKAEAAITDPPYDVGIDYGAGTDDQKGRAEYGRWCQQWLAHLPGRRIFTVGVKHLLWWDDIAGLPQWTMAWIRRNGQSVTGLGGTSKWDAILVYGCDVDMGIDIIDLPCDFNERLSTSGAHPVAKPVPLWCALITRFSKQQGVVLDPFLGSGTTMIAPEQLGRRCVGIEIEPRYVDVAVRRWEQFTGKKAVRETRSRIERH